jgi:hypothetical protein
MTTFIDGPAQGEVLRLKRAPLFLRVVQNGCAFDGLDQIEDEPAATEIIYVYQLCERPAGHVTTTGGTYPIARYRYFDPQPADSLVRENHSWKGWTQRTWDALKQRVTP